MSYEPQRYDPAAHRRRVQSRPPESPPQQGFYGQQPPVTWQEPGRPPQPVYGFGVAPPRKRRRVFMWVFLAVQVLFIAWIAAGLASHPAGPSAAAQAVQQCANGGWQGLFRSQADCRQHYAVALSDASDAGKGIGVAIIIVFWCVVDFLMGITYLVVRLSRRRGQAA